MKKNTKLMMVIAVLAMLFSSCQKEGVFNPSKKINTIVATATVDGAEIAGKNGTVQFAWDGKLLEQIRYVDTKGDVLRSVTYSYDGNNRLSQVNSTEGYTLKYGYNGKYMDHIDLIIDNELCYIYHVIHENGLLSEIKVETVGEPFDTKGINPFFGFLPDQISSQINASVSKGLVPNECWVFSTSDRNVIGVAHVYGSVVDQYTYKLDNKKNPLSGWADAINSEWGVAFSNHNIVSYELQRKIASDEVSYTEKVDYNYVYSGGYPVSKTWTAPSLYYGNVDYSETYDYR